MQRSTVICLILLRLAIGWHFLFEGLQKVRSVYMGETVASRPFSSAGYFREAPGPLGEAMRRAVGDPDEAALARLVVRPRGEEADPATDRPHERIPPGLKNDWDSLLQRYARHYSFDQDKQKAAELKLSQAAATLVGWLEYQPAPVLEAIRSRFGRLENVDPASLTEKERFAYQAYLDNTAEVTTAYPGGEVKRRMTATARLELYRAKLAELREMSKVKPSIFGKDVEGARVRQIKAEVARLRSSLLTDLEGHTKALMAGLNQVAAGPDAAAFDRLVSLRSKAEEEKLTEKLKGTDAAKALTPLLATLGAIEQETASIRTLTPAEAGRLTVRPLNGAQVQAALPPLTDRLWKDTKPVKEAAGTVTDEKAGADLRSLIDEVEKTTASIPKALKGLPDVEPLPPLPEDRLMPSIDWATRWGLTVIGACLLIGLFTRFNCLLAAGFLFMTYLAVPALPWFPAVGPSEGNYLFVNKNVIEMLALLALATTPSGRWFGVDAILHGIRVLMFGGKNEQKR